MSSVLAYESVTVVNASYEPLGSTKLKRALALVFDGKAVIDEEDPSRIIRSKGKSLFFPLVIRLIHYVKVTYHYGEVFFSKRGVLERDRFRCGYCGGKATTHDHIHPKSRGGEDSWLNSIAACLSCNATKANRTPEEAGMVLKFPPRVPDAVYIVSDKPKRKKKNK